MNFPDMSNYNLDAVSMLWGAFGGAIFSNLGFCIFAIIKSIFTFTKWLIKRKDGCENDFENK